MWPDPACGENIHDGKGIFERRVMTQKQVRELAKQPKYMKEQLRKVLEEGPQQSAAMEDMSDDEDRGTLIIPEFGSIRAKLMGKIWKQSV